MTDTNYRHFRLASDVLLWTGVVGACYSALLVVIACFAWLLDVSNTTPGYQPAGPVITGYLLRLVLFLLAYAAGSVLPVLVPKPQPAPETAGQE